MRVVFVHGACVRDGDWWWHRTAASLQAGAIESVAVPLPSCGEAGRPAGPGVGLDDDAAALRSVLAGSDEPTVLVAHSYGGIVAAEALDGSGTVGHLLLISSYLPEPGESLSSFGGPEPAAFLAVDPDAGTFSVRPADLTATFLHDCPADVAEQAPLHLAAQSLSVTQQPVRTAGWKQVPTTYLVCAADRGTPADRQREFARRADNVLELDSGHHPFLSRPDEVARLIADLP